MKHSRFRKLRRGVVRGLRWHALKGLPILVCLDEQTGEQIQVIPGRSQWYVRRMGDPLPPQCANAPRRIDARRLAEQMYADERLRLAMYKIGFASFIGIAYAWQAVSP